MPFGAGGGEPSAIKRMIPVDLEDLFTGFTKKMKVTKKIQDLTGRITTSSTVVTIDGKAGWKAGTKIMFPGVGDEIAGAPAQDIHFVIEEKPHPIFKRVVSMRNCVVIV